MKTLLLVVVCTIAFIVSMCFIENKRTENINKQNLEYQQALMELNAKKEETIEPVVETKKEKETIEVNITGAVNDPGSYEVRKDAYLDEVITLAGGVTSSADVTSYNLYYQIPSDMNIYIPNGTGDNKISINTADADTLDMLPGVGVVLAGRIIEYRNLIGSFQSIDQLREVEGLGNSIFDKLKDHVKL